MVDMAACGFTHEHHKALVLLVIHFCNTTTVIMKFIAMGSVHISR